MLIENRPVQRLDIAGNRALFADTGAWEDLTDDAAAGPARIVRAGADVVRGAVVRQPAPSGRLARELADAGLPVAAIRRIEATVRALGGVKIKTAAARLAKEVAGACLACGLEPGRIQAVVDLAVAELIEQAEAAAEDRAARPAPMRASRVNVARLAARPASEPERQAAPLPAGQRGRLGSIRREASPAAASMAGSPRGRVDLTGLRRAAP